MQGSDSAGTFTAYVTTIPNMLFSNDARLSSSLTHRVPLCRSARCSTFRTSDLASSMIYADLVGAGANGQNLITDTLTTPWGTDIDLSWLVQGSDAAAGLNPADRPVSVVHERSMA